MGLRDGAFISCIGYSVFKKVMRDKLVITTVTTISDKNYGKNCCLDNFVLLTPSLLLTMLRNNEKNLPQCTLWVRNIL